MRMTMCGAKHVVRCAPAVVSSAGATWAPAMAARHPPRIRRWAVAERPARVRVCARAHARGHTHVRAPVRG